MTMEMNRASAVNPKTEAPTSALLSQKTKAEPNAPKFIQALAEAVEAVTSKTIPSESAIPARQTKPRSHLDLVSLNPIQTSFIPQAAALERVGNSRVLPFALGG